MNSIERALMLRDGDTYEEAHQRYKELTQYCEDCDYDYMDIETYMIEELGLEMDYITDLL